MMNGLVTQREFDQRIRNNKRHSALVATRFLWFLRQDRELSMLLWGLQAKVRQCQVSNSQESVVVVLLCWPILGEFLLDR